jgi:hypothetical protein
MKTVFDNPYPVKSDEYLIWEVLVKNDFEGFLNSSWEMVADDYIEDGFFGIDFGKSTLPVQWKLEFPSLEIYKNKWLVDSHDFQKNNFAADPQLKLYESCNLIDIQITGTSALVHKLFNGSIPIHGSSPLSLNWLSLFLLRKQQGKWRIAGFCGYMNSKAS